MNNKDYFGFLNINEVIDFKQGVISPIEEFFEAQDWMNEYLNKDGFIYPPIENQIIQSSENGFKKVVVPQSERPAFLHKLPISHSIEIYNPVYENDLREYDYSFIISMLAYLYGTRLQFANWWFDQRVPIYNQLHFKISKNYCAEILDSSYSNWKMWDFTRQKLIINILTLFNRIPTYEWEFERFSFEYMVFDGLFKFYSELNKVKKKILHSERFQVICEFYNLDLNPSALTKIVNFRNKFFHEASWGEGLPHSPKGMEDLECTMNLRKFNSRLMLAVLGINNSFIQSSWTKFGIHKLDLHKAHK